MGKGKVSPENLERGQRIKSIRMLKNWTQENLAEIFDISTSALKKIESGENNITIREMEILHKEAGVSADFILFGEVQENKDLEMSFETLTGEQKYRLIMRLILYLCNVENEKYKNIIEEIIESIK